MDILLWFAGLFIGLFLWSNILGSIFATLPLELARKKAGFAGAPNYAKIILPIIFATTVITLFWLYQKNLFYGNIFGGVIMLFNIGKLKREAAENALNDIAHFTKEELHDSGS